MFRKRRYYREIDNFWRNWSHEDSTKDMQTVAMRNIVAAMQKYGVSGFSLETGNGYNIPPPATDD